MTVYGGLGDELLCEALECFAATFKVHLRAFGNRMLCKMHGSSLSNHRWELARAHAEAGVLTERASSADVIEHLVEIDRRQLYLEQACRSLSCFCFERVGYSEDEAAKRVRVTRLRKKFPRVLAELRNGTIHLTGLSLLAPVMTNENCGSLLAQARGKSKRDIEHLLAKLCAVAGSLSILSGTTGAP